MSKKLSLVVLRNKRVVEFVRLGEHPDCFGPIVPKRKPQQTTPNSKIWIIDTAKRQALVKHIEGVYEKLEAMWVKDKETYRTCESLSGWFGTMGLVTRWAEDKGVVWGLYLSNNDIWANEPLRA